MTYSRAGTAIAAIVVAVGLCFGCHARNYENGDISFSFGTTFTIAHHGPEKDEAQVGIDFQPWMQKPVVDWIVELNDGQSVEPE